MPGVADPNYQQSGGINNPGRTMSLTINGQPATNTVVRLDGITATNQFFESILVPRLGGPNQSRFVEFRSCFRSQRDYCLPMSGQVARSPLVSW